MFDKVFEWYKGLEESQEQALIGAIIISLVLWEVTIFIVGTLALLSCVAKVKDNEWPWE